MADKESKPQLTGAFDLFYKSKDLVMKNLTVFLLLYLFPFIISASRLYQVNVRHDRSGGWTGFGGITGLPTYAFLGLIGFGTLVFFAIVVFSLIVNAMTTGLLLESADGKKPDLSQLWQYGKKYWLRLFGLGIVVGLMTVGGFILLIVPGLIVIRRYFLAPYFLVDKDLSIGEAMRQSAAASKPYSGWIWSIIGVMILIGIIGAFPIIGWLVSFILGMFYSVAPALRYFELKKLAKA